jgi:hypothetical protein
MIQYTDAEVNTPLSEESFVLSDEAGTEISKPR